MTFCWLSSSFNYYMVSFLLKYFPGNIYVNSIMSVLSELIAYAVGGVMFDKLGVKLGFIVAFGIAFAGGLGIVYYETASKFFSDNPAEEPSWIFPALVLIAKFGIAAAFNLDYVSNSVLFPTLFTATAMGFCNFLARIATILSP